MAYWFMAILLMAVCTAAWVRYHTLTVPAVIALLFAILFGSTLPHRMDVIIYVAGALVFAKLLSDFFMEKKTH